VAPAVEVAAAVEAVEAVAAAALLLQKQPLKSPALGPRRNRALKARVVPAADVEVVAAVVVSLDLEAHAVRWSIRVSTPLRSPRSARPIRRP
jgi:hypothetical protein